MIITGNRVYYNVTSHFFTPFIMQPARIKSRTLIDNIFINTIEYPLYSVNLTVQLSDHLFQFTILEGFYKDLTPMNILLSEMVYLMSDLYKTFYKEIC